MKEKVIAVVGAGIMGSDVSFDLASHNYNVILKDLREEYLQKAEERIRKNFKLMKLTKKDFSADTVDGIISRIKFITDYAGFENADFLLENINENFELKKKLFLELKDVCTKDTIFGSNTSCISITKIGALMPHPDNVIGMHFLNPIPLKNLVEVIRGFHTSDETVEKTKGFLRSDQMR